MLSSLRRSIPEHALPGSRAAAEGDLREDEISTFFARQLGSMAPPRDIFVSSRTRGLISSENPCETYNIPRKKHSCGLDVGLGSRPPVECSDDEQHSLRRSSRRWRNTEVLFGSTWGSHPAAKRSDYALVPSDLLQNPPSSRAEIPVLYTPFSSSILKKNRKQIRV